MPAVSIIDPAWIPASSACAADNSEPCGSDAWNRGLAVSAAVMKPQLHSGLSVGSPDFDYERVNVVHITTCSYISALIF